MTITNMQTSTAIVSEINRHIRTSPKKLFIDVPGTTDINEVTHIVLDACTQDVFIRLTNGLVIETSDTMLTSLHEQMLSALK